MYTTAVLFVCFVLGVVFVKMKNKKNHSTAPGPVGWPILGNLPQLGRKPHLALTSLRNAYGDVYQLQMGSYPTVVLNGIKAIRQALVKQADDFAGRPDFYSFQYIANGKSMGFSNFGARWKLHRQIAQNALATCSSRKFNPIEEAIVTEARFLVSNLLSCSNNIVDPHNEIYLSVGNIICALCFGKWYQRDDPDFKQLVKNNADFMAFVGAGNPVDIMPWMRHFTKRSFNQFLSILDTMTSLCERKVREHMLTYDPSIVRDITDSLIKAKHEIPAEEKASVGLTDEHIMVTLQELIGAGFDTIASTLQWAVLYLMTNPDWQEKVYAEIHDKYGHTEDPDFNDISDLPLTEATILETMRHSCIFPLALPHSTTKDTTLNGHFIKSDTLVFVNLWSVSHDPEYFPEPELFNPRRFLNSACTEIDRSQVELFMPFGVGKRSCPGEQIAKLELFLFFTTMVQSLKFDPVPGKVPIVDSKYGLTLKPVDFHVRVSKRE